MVNDNNSAEPAGPGDTLAPHVSKVRTPPWLARRILIVDDDPDSRDLLSHLLSGAGYRVACAEDGEAGWDALCGSSFDAMITDHDMPRLTGLELLRRVRAGPIRLPVILISGEMPWHARDLARLLLPGLAIEKPFGLSEFLVNVRDTFGPARYSDIRPRGGGARARSPSRPPRQAGLVA